MYLNNKQFYWEPEKRRERHLDYLTAFRSLLLQMQMIGIRECDLLMNQVCFLTFELPLTEVFKNLQKKICIFLKLKMK